MTEFIAACRPVVWTPKYAEIAEPTPVYPGSIQCPCTSCGVAIWLGPRQQASKATPYCFLCAAQKSASDNADGSTPVVSLGNPYKPRRDDDE